MDPLKCFTKYCGVSRFILAKHAIPAKFYTHLFYHCLNNDIVEPVGTLFAFSHCHKRVMVGPTVEEVL